jgi:hypothetical protein
MIRETQSIDSIYLSLVRYDKNRKSYNIVNDSTSINFQYSTLEGGNIYNSYKLVRIVAIELLPNSYIRIVPIKQTFYNSKQLSNANLKYL